jgi:hypothetical protein
MPGTVARIAWKAEDRLIAMIALHLSTGNSSIGETLEAGVVHEDIHAAEGLLLERDELGDFARLSHVRGRIDGLDPEIALDR